MTNFSKFHSCSSEIGWVLQRPARRVGLEFAPGEQTRWGQQQERGYMTMRNVRGCATSFENARNSFAKLNWLAHMAGYRLSSDLRCVGGASCEERAAASPYKLQSRKYRHHGNGRLHLVRRNSPRQQAPEHHTRNTTDQEMVKNRQADRAKTPVKRAAYDCQYQSKKQVRSHNLRGRHFGIVQQKNSSQRSSTCRGKPRFHSNWQSEPGKPSMVFSGERGIMYAPDKGHAG